MNRKRISNGIPIPNERIKDTPTAALDVDVAAVDSCLDMRPPPESGNLGGIIMH